MSDTVTPVATDPVKQFSVFIESRVGRFFDLVALLTAHNVHIMAITMVDASDTAIDRLVVDDPDRARELLAANNFAYTECDILAVEFSDGTQLKHILGALLAVELNIHYAYAFLLRPEGKLAIAIHCEDNELAAQSVNSRGFKVLTQHDISR
jgi:hypothetical protein